MWYRIADMYRIWSSPAGLPTYRITSAPTSLTQVGLPNVALRNFGFVYSYALPFDFNDLKMLLTYRETPRL